MDQARVTLPVRLAPRKRALIFRLCFFAVFFIFSVFWTFMVSVKGTHVEFNDVEVTDPKWRALFPLWGIPFVLIGLGGFISTVLKILPGSPYYHLDLSVDGLIVRGLTKQQSFAWHDLPPLTLKVDSDSEGGPFHYVVAMGGRTPSGKQREILCIPADQYGTKNSEQGAGELAAWINRIRDLALQSRLDTGTQIEVPDGFARTVINMSAMASTGAKIERTVTRVG